MAWHSCSVVSVAGIGGIGGARWVPACAGMTGWGAGGSCLRRNDGLGRRGSCLRRNDGLGRRGSCLRRNDDGGRGNDGGVDALGAAGGIQQLCGD